MSIKTAKVAGRRVLKFQSLDEMLADAEQITSGPVRCMGNWSAGQILKHLAIAVESAITGVDYTHPWYIRLTARLMKRHFLNCTMEPGFQMPQAMKAEFMPPDDVSIGDGLSALRQSVTRFRAATELAPSKIFGQMTRDEAEKFQLRHAEMHLSFLVPDGSA